MEIGTLFLNDGQLSLTFILAIALGVFVAMVVAVWQSKVARENGNYFGESVFMGAFFGVCWGLLTFASALFVEFYAILARDYVTARIGIIVVVLPIICAVIGARIGD